MADPLNQVTPLILTYNEEANIGRSLEGLRWAKRILVIDSGSTDSTLKILAAHPQVEVVQRQFDSFAEQCNFGLGLINTKWCLSLDADHIVTPDFKLEMTALIEGSQEDLTAVKTPFRYLIHGQTIRSSLLPPRFNLIRPRHGTYVNDGHGHQFIPAGGTCLMHQPLLHDDRKPLERWFHSQSRYHYQEANKLIHMKVSEMGLADKIRRLTPLAPLLILFTCLFWKRGIFDGRAGIHYAFQRCFAELQIWLMLDEIRQTSGTTPSALINHEQ